MHTLERLRALRAWQVGAMLGGLGIVGLAVGGGALGAAGSPGMNVSPSPIGVKYSQTVEVTAQNLPKGSGSIAVTICGLNNAAGQKIASPGADDCAGANDLSSGLVKLQTWTNGTFDQKYTLPASGQKFGTNQRFCDATHYCAIAVADANPSAPAYYLTTELQFTNQAAIATTPTTVKPTATTSPATGTTTGSPTTVAPAPGGTTTAPTTTATTPTDNPPSGNPPGGDTTTPPTDSTPAPATTVAPGVSGTAGGTGSAGSGGVGITGSVGITVTPPSAGGTGGLPIPSLPSLPALPTGQLPNPVPSQAATAVTQACAQVVQAVSQAGGNASALTIACSTLVNGGGGAQLQALLQSPSLGCVELSSATQNNAQLASACSQLASALQPYSAQLGSALTPILGLLP